MRSDRVQTGTARPLGGLPSGDYRALSQEILRCANSDLAQVDLLGQIARTLLDFSGCEAVELRVRRGESQCFRCEAARRRRPSVSVEVERWRRQDEKSLSALAGESNRVGKRCGTIVVPVTAAGEMIGLLQLRSRRANHFREIEVECYETVAQALGVALVSQRAHALLRERIKELTCLYNLAQLVERLSAPLKEILQTAAGLLPPAWQYPEITAAKIAFDDDSYATPGFRECVHRQSAKLVIDGRQRGSVEVGYTDERPELDEGPFLEEERSLINGVARQIAILIERREADEAKDRLQDQLRHADRLATIGQLSAGIAHELNEPLGNILAFAQLACKEPGVSPQVARDLKTIVTTSLHAREIIKKLMLFARQIPPHKTRVNLNVVIEGGLYLLESRCLKEGVAVRRHLSKKLPEIVADPSQLNQVLVNLVVNAIQAMPGGGELKITTRAGGGRVVLIVEDTGIGMRQEVLDNIFTPFFTTKDIHEGTGLGLPVVHGIVISHGGTIDVQSSPGKGARFEIRLPAAGAVEDKEIPGNENEVAS